MLLLGKRPTMASRLRHNNGNSDERSNPHGTGQACRIPSGCSATDATDVGYWTIYCQSPRAGWGGALGACVMLREGPVFQKGPERAPF